MNYGVDLIFAEHSLQNRLIAHIAAHNLHLVYQTCAHQFTLRYPVAHEAHHVGACLEQSSHEPAAKQSTSARHESRTVLPELFVR